MTQDGDWEGCLHLDRLPTADEAVVIREVLGIRKRRHMTAEALSKLERTRGLIKSPNLAPHSAPEGALPASYEASVRLPSASAAPHKRNLPRSPGEICP